MDDLWPVSHPCTPTPPPAQGYLVESMPSGPWGHFHQSGGAEGRRSFHWSQARAGPTWSGPCHPASFLRGGTSSKAQLGLTSQEKHKSLSPWGGVGPTPGKRKEFGTHDSPLYGSQIAFEKKLKILFCFPLKENCPHKEALKDG